MNVLIACEESQTICIEFRKLGVNAFSCDLMECSGNHPEWHIKDDCIKLINGNCNFKTMDDKKHKICGKWDLLIAHPPCTFLSNAGARWLYAGNKLNKERYKKGLQAKEFFMKFYNADCDKILIENPMPSKIYNLPEYTQIIQPYEFGEPYSKKTYLWLKGLPILQPTKIINDYLPYITSGSYSKNHNEKYKGASRKGGSSKSRSKTFKGIAIAIAKQYYLDYLWEEAIKECEGY